MKATYILPIRLADRSGVAELASYLRAMEGLDIVVVDASPAPVFRAMQEGLDGIARHVAPDERYRGANGKARGVLTGLALATEPKIVVADDDVRYDAVALQQVLNKLDEADVVRPQNYFSPAPWHAILDGARSLVNRALDGDWPGTLAFRAGALPKGYNADVLFENFELVRTIRARGGREVVARGIFVARRPPSVSHFFGQRVRQAYDEFARPVRMVVALTILPLALTAFVSRSWILLAAIPSIAMALAFAGWIREGASRYFSLLSVIASPIWLAERSICAWLALYERRRFGGVRYGGAVIALASSRAHELRRWAT